jgi:hypothetical protein
MSTVITNQPVAGLTPPAIGEARIRDAYPSVAANFAVATLGYRLTQTIFLAPVAWLVMSLAYFGKVLPFMARRYSLTNRRLMIRAGWAGKPIAEVPLSDIEEVRIVTDANSNFFRAATLEIVKGGKVVLTLPGVPEPDAFRQSILTAADAWVPGRCKAIPFISAADFKG